MESGKIEFIDEVSVEEKKNAGKVYIYIDYNREGMKRYRFCNDRKSTHRMICLCFLLYALLVSFLCVCFGLLCYSPDSSRIAQTINLFLLVPLVMCPFLICESLTNEIVLDDKQRIIMMRYYDHVFGFFEIDHKSSVKKVSYADLTDFQVRLTKNSVVLEVVDKEGETTQLATLSTYRNKMKKKETLMFVGQDMKDLILRSLKKEEEMVDK